MGHSDLLRTLCVEDAIRFLDCAPRCGELKKWGWFLKRRGCGQMKCKEVDQNSSILLN